MAARREQMRDWAAEWADVALLVAFGCATFLLLGIAMPNWFARTSWSHEGRNSGTRVIDSPASYVGLVSLCGLLAFVALAVSLWRRVAIAGALAAATAFSFAAYIAVNFWLGFSGGVILLDGRPVQGMDPPKWTVHLPTALPLFIIAAVVGAVASLTVAVGWARQPRGT